MTNITDKILCIIILFIAPGYLCAQITGFVYDEEKNPLPGATIYVVEEQLGTASNADGFYSININPGTYTIIYRFLGFETKREKYTISDKAFINAILKPQVTILSDVDVKAKRGDPANSIMRKAIAKAKWHQLIVEKSTSLVYMKGTGRVNQIPFFLRKTMENEGVDTSRYFVQESVSEIIFESPNTIKERVLSIRTSGDDNNSSPNEYLKASFYESEIAETISPLSTRAFTYYNFEYQGYFEDEGKIINRIKVIPKSEGDHVFSGMIAIVDGDWGIYSTDLKTSKIGFEFKINQVYQNFKQFAWLPVTHKFEINGKVMGIGVEYKYLASVNKMDVILNNSMLKNIKVVDAKEEEAPENIEKESLMSGEIQQDNKAVFTARELRKQSRKAEKELLNNQKEPDIVLTRVKSIDSLAYKRDPNYWEKVRNIPLTENEKKGYRTIDSLAGNLEKDTVKNKNRKATFKPVHLLSGNSYRTSKNTRLIIDNFLTSIRYNTVEGVNGTYGLGFRIDKKSIPRPPEESKLLSRWKFSSKVRYSAATNRFRPLLSIDYNTYVNNKNSELGLEIGESVFQINNSISISSLMNSIYTLLGERNFMKLYESKYFSLNFKKQLSGKYRFTLSGQMAERSALYNQWSFILIDWMNVEYTANNPDNISLAGTDFQTHLHYGADFGFYMKPWLKYRLYNGRKRAINTSSPEIFMKFRLGSTESDTLSSQYLEVKTGFKHKFDLLLGDLKSDITGGIFPVASNVLFPDYHHFLGNRTIFENNRFRNLDYYSFSTVKPYISIRNDFLIRPNFLLTKIPFIRKGGLKERLVFNYLTTPEMGHYYEIGYGFDRLFKIIRLELVASFIDSNFDMFGVRIGISEDLNIEF